MQPRTYYAALGSSKTRKSVVINEVSQKNLNGLWCEKNLWKIDVNLGVIG